MQISSCCTRARGMSLLTVFVFLLKTLNDGLPVHSSPTSLPGTSEDIRDKMDFNASVKKARGFVCRMPRERAYNLKDLMSNLSLHGSDETANQPTYLVLNRCDVHSGCCGSVDKSCSPASAYFEEVEVQLESVSTDCKKKVWLRVEHHERCHCKETNSSERAASATQLPSVTIIGNPSKASCTKIN